MPQNLLQEELKNENPLNISRLVNGVLAKKRYYVNIKLQRYGTI